MPNPDTDPMMRSPAGESAKLTLPIGAPARSMIVAVACTAIVADDADAGPGGGAGVVTTAAWPQAASPRPIPTPARCLIADGRWRARPPGDPRPPARESMA